MLQHSSKAVHSCRQTASIGRGLQLRNSRCLRCAASGRQQGRDEGSHSIPEVPSSSIDNIDALLGSAEGEWSVSTHRRPIRQIRAFWGLYQQAAHDAAHCCSIALLSISTRQQPITATGPHGTSKMSSAAAVNGAVADDFEFCYIPGIDSYNGFPHTPTLTSGLEHAHSAKHPNVAPILVSHSLPLQTLSRSSTQTSSWCPGGS